MPMFTKTELKQRGWIEKAIDKFLGSPDKVKRNPYSKKAAPMQLWDTSRVEAVEQTEEFKAWQQKTTERRAAQSKRLKERHETEKQNRPTPLSNPEQFQIIQETLFSFSEQEIKALKEDGCNEDLISKAETAISRMLALSYWVPIDKFFKGFERYYVPDKANSEEYIQSLMESLKQHGWRGIPLISLDGFKLSSGAHRYEALKRLTDQGWFEGKEFKVPVFDLLHYGYKVFSKRFMDNLLEVYETLGGIKALQYVSRHCLFESFVTGIDQQ